MTLKNIMIAGVAVLAISACSKKDKAEVPVNTPEPAAVETTEAPVKAPVTAETPAAADVAPDLVAFGYPTWKIEVRGNTLKHIRPAKPEGVDRKAVRTEENGTVFYKSGKLTLAVTNTECQDEKKGETFPKTATLLLADKTFMGCAQ